MRDYRRWVDPALKQEYKKASEGSPQRLHASLALLPVDPGQVKYLFDRMLKASPTELPGVQSVWLKGCDVHAASGSWVGVLLRI
jgi:hypothetical protein